MTGLKVRERMAAFRSTNLFQEADTNTTWKKGPGDSPAVCEKDVLCGHTCAAAVSAALSHTPPPHTHARTCSPQIVAVCRSRAGNETFLP